MLAVGGAYQVTRLIEGGYRGAVLDNLLRRAFPDARTQSIQALRRYGRRVTDATTAAYSAPGFARIAPPPGAGNPNLAPGVWYQVRFTYRNADGSKRDVVVHVQADQPLNKVGIYEAARGILADAERRAYLTSPLQPAPLPEPEKVRLVLVEAGR